MEIRYKNEIFRGSTLSPSHAQLFKNVMYPTCIELASTAREDKDLYERGMRRIKLHNYLA